MNSFFCFVLFCFKEMMNRVSMQCVANGQLLISIYICNLYYLHDILYMVGMLFGVQ